MLRIFFERFESLSNGSNLHSNASNPFQMVRISIRMLRIPFEYMIQISIRIPLEWFEFALECFESILNGYNFSFECLECHLRGLNLHSNASNLVRMLQISFECLEFTFEWFKSLSSGLNFDSNASLPFRMF